MVRVCAAHGGGSEFPNFHGTGYKIRETVKNHGTGSEIRKTGSKFMEQGPKFMKYC